MRQRCKVSGKGLPFKTETANYRMPVEIGPEDVWLHRLKGCIGDGAKEIGISYFTDVSIFLTVWEGCPALLFGPGESKLCHKPNEYVKISKYFEAVCVMEKFCGYSRSD